MQNFLSRFWVTVLVLAAIASFSLWEPLSIRSAALELQPLSQGQVWRIFSAHFFHLSPTHMVMNAAAYLMVVIVFREVLSPSQEIACLVMLPLFVSVGVLLFDQSAEWYVGLSGVIHGLLMRCAIVQWREGQLQRFSGIVIFIIFVKVLIEQMGLSMQFLPQQDIGGVVVITSHLFGAIGGVVLGLAHRVVRRL